MRYFILLSVMAATVSSFAQEVHKCYTHEAMQSYEADHPGYIASVNEIFERAKLHNSGDRSTEYNVKVVFHVVFNTPEKILRIRW